MFVAFIKTPLLGNRVDRFTWDGSTLAFAQNIIRLRAIQQDAGQPERGNHDGGVLRFGSRWQALYFLWRSRSAGSVAESSRWAVWARPTGRSVWRPGTGQCSP